MSEDRSTRRVTEVLESLRDARGYLLPHHGPMAAALPDLHDAYRAMYRALTLDRRHLSELERECVWVALLAALGEAVGTHHIRAFRAAGGEDAVAGALFRLGAWAIGAEEHRFLDDGWARHFPGFDPARSYLEGAAALGVAALPPGVGRMVLCAIHAARGNQWALRLELEAAYVEAVPEPKIAEALSLMIWPRGVNPFVRAAQTWLDLLRSGRVEPGPDFAAWRDTAAQGPLSLDD